MDAVENSENLTTAVIEKRFFSCPVSRKKEIVAKCCTILYRAVILSENYRMSLNAANRPRIFAVYIRAALLR